MSVTYRTVEHWRFACQHCGHEWVTVYEKQYVELTACEVVTWRRGGHPCTTPWSEQVCPACGSYRVRLRPSVTPRSTVSA
jgi:Zn finger protein HypA/HybF involved in hydrogenase expression